MALSTYADLVPAIASWLDRVDLTDRIPDFIALAEARFRDVLTDAARELRVTTTVDSSELTLPDDFSAIRSLVLTGATINTWRVPQPLTQLSLIDFQAKGGDFTDTPQYFAITASTLLVWPVPDDSYTATLVYQADIPALSDSNQTNWLLARRPDLYLRASLLEAEFFGWNDDRLPLIKSAVDEHLAELDLAGRRRRYGSAPLAARPAVNERATNAGWR
jgi:hypothetical protein